MTNQAKHPSYHDVDVWKSLIKTVAHMIALDPFESEEEADEKQVR